MSPLSVTQRLSLRASTIGSTTRGPCLYQVGTTKQYNQILSILILDDKYEVVTVDSGYKVFMKLHIRNITKWDFIEYR